jgi:hypothetical protein
MSKKEFTADEVNKIAKENWIAGKSEGIIQLKWVLQVMHDIEYSVNVNTHEYWEVLRTKIGKHLKHLGRMKIK